MQFPLVLILTGLVLATFGPSWATQPPLSAGTLDADLSALVGSRDAVMVAAPDGTVLADIHADQLCVPASILKVLTSLAALHYLGPDYRYPTEFYMDKNNDLKIKGYGDPLLVSERIQPVARQLARRVSAVRDLILDATYFKTPIVIPGRGESLEPYDAPNGALCVNFNTVAFERRDGRWVSGEPQTPLLPSVLPKVQASGLTSGRITLAGDSREAIVYAGELLCHFLAEAGMSVEGRILQGRVDLQHDTLLWRHQSPDQLSDIIANLMEFSNNFIANQLMLTMGAQAYGPPATVEKGLKALWSYYHQELGIADGHIAEASGISRDNRISARIMIQLLDRFQPHHQLMRHNGRHWYKTGHLKGIRTQAGYLVGNAGQLYRYVVMVNTPGKTTRPILRVIERALP